ncbi:MAG TPA: response regulator [Verrucomicrobiae bacterium]|nr:response regulator [Verrucomicrobiae bacterium]
MHAPETLPTETAGVARNKPTMLVVDDEEGPRQSLKVLFKDDFNILLADDGPAGIKLAQEHPIDVAVLDIRMAGMSGLEVLERLKFVDPGIEVVMMTAFETSETLHQALRLRACDYVNKPFDVNTMRKAVSTALERRSFASETKTNVEKLSGLQGALDEVQLQERIARDQGEVYASIIHDINTPITIISGTIQSINQQIGGATSLGKDDVARVKEQLTRITRQVNTCIDISRRYLESIRRTPDESAQVNVNEILGDVRETLRFDPTSRGHQIVIQPLPENPAARIHGIDLVQILTNLSRNALQCSAQPHKVELKGVVLKEAIDIEPLNSGPHDRFLNREGFSNEPPLIALSISDNGPGIPISMMDKIFQRGFTTKAAHSGSGLGLSIVQRWVKRSRGGLHLHSEPGKGTTFTVYLRAAQSRS